MFLLFSNSMGKDQLYPSTALPLAKNRLFSQYHAQYPEHEQNLIVEELVKETCIHLILFVTIAFDLGIDCNNIRGVIHIGVPHTMKDYCQEGRPGWKRWSISQGRYLLQLLQYLQIRKNMSDEMKKFVQSKQCKRKMILSNFDHDVLNNHDPANVL